MATGMGRVASQSMEDLTGVMNPDDQMVLESARAIQAIEVGSLPAELCKEAVEVLQERDISTQPLKAFGIKCANTLNDNGMDDEDEQPKRRRKKKDSQGAMAQLLFSFMPILTWLPKLRPRGIRDDIISGITVGVMVIPQSMSYAAIAGLPYINGMYSAAVPTLIYGLFGQSKQLAVGPVAMVSLLVEAGLRGKLTEAKCPEWYAQGGDDAGPTQYELCPEAYVGLACLTALVVGVMQVVASILKLGFLVSFLGHPVTSGFTSASAIIIGLSQAKDMLGYDIPKSQFIYITLWNIVKDLNKLKGMTLFLGILTFSFLVFNKSFARKHPKVSMLGPLGPLIACILTTFLIWLVPALYEEYHVKYVGHVPEGLMPISADFSMEDVPQVMPTALSSCLIGYMESIAIGKNLASKHNYDIDAGQEMLALGISNLVGSIFSCYPVTGSFSRSAVNNQTGATSQFAGLVTSGAMFLTLMFLTPLFYYLPKFVLAAIVMNSVMSLVAFGEAKRLFRVKKSDFVLWVVAFIGTLFLGVLIGILVAMALSLVIVISESVHPQITVLWRIPGTVIYRNMKQESKGSFIPNVFICRIGSSLYFANAAYVKEMLLHYVSDLEEVNPTQYIVIEMTAVTSIDSSACHVIHDIVTDFRQRKIHVAFANVGMRAETTMKKAHLKQHIRKEWFFASVDEAVRYCILHKHAKQTKQEFESITGLDVGTIDIAVSNEIGFSNDLTSDHTMVFLTLVREAPTIISEISSVFKQNQLNVVRTQIEPLADDGAKHTYFLKSGKTNGKLSDKELDRVREDLENVIKTIQDQPRASLKQQATSSQVAQETEKDRIARLESTVRRLSQKPGATNQPQGGGCGQPLKLLSCIGTE